MSDWLSELHLKMVTNYKILLGELIKCSTVDFFLFTFWALFAISSFMPAFETSPNRSMKIETRA